MFEGFRLDSLLVVGLPVECTRGDVDLEEAGPTFLGLQIVGCRTSTLHCSAGFVLVVM